MTAPPDDLDPVIADNLRQLYELERRGERTPLYIGPFTAYELISMLQLALRHPHIVGAQRVRIETLARTLVDAWFRGELRDFLERGFDPAHDLPRSSS